MALTAVLAILFAVMLYFDLVYSGPLPDHYLVSGWNDLILHTGAFGLLSLFAFVVQGLRFPILLLLVVVGVAFEGGQIYLPGREVAITDLAANFFGIVLAACLVQSVILFREKFRAIG